MRDVQFKKKILRAIKNFNMIQIQEFIWLYAVRIMPYLNNEKHLIYREKDEQERLEVISQAINCCISSVAATSDNINDFGIYCTKYIQSARNTRLRIFLFLAAVVATGAFYIVLSTTVGAVGAVFSIFFGIFFAADAFLSIQDARNACKNAFYIIENIIGFDTVKLTILANNKSENNKTSIVEILFDDIELLKTGETDKRNNDKSVYGEILGNFLDSLRNAGCGYWADLYINLFEKKFIADEGDMKELHRRLNIPIEIREQGVSAVGRYMMDLADEAECLNEARIIILGDKGAGKTSIANKLINPNAEMPSLEDSTEGVTVLPWQLGEDGEKKMNVHVWDFAGDVITHSVHRCFMQARCLYIYVYDGRIEYNNRPEYWLEQIKIYSENAPILFLINVKDIHKPTVEQNRLEREYRSIQGFHCFNIEKNERELNEFRKVIMNILRNNPTWRSQELPAAAFRIKEELRTHFDETQADAITREHFYKIAEKNGALARKYDDILDDLHVLGICFRYTFEGAAKTVVLNTAWITYGIYRIIRWGEGQGKYNLTVNDGALIFKSPEEQKRYPKDKIEFIFELMCEYELGFFKKVALSNQPKEIVIPLLMPVDRPKSESLLEFPMDKSLRMVFEVEKALPPNIVPRVVVQRHEDHEDIPDSVLWRKGALLHFRRGIATALVVEDLRKITVDVKGPDRTPYIAELRDTLIGIFATYKKIDPDLFYRLIVPYELTKKEYLAKEEVIMIHHERGRPIPNEHTGSDMPTSPTFIAYDMRKRERRRDMIEGALIKTVIKNMLEWIKLLFSG